MSSTPRKRMTLPALRSASGRRSIFGGRRLGGPRGSLMVNGKDWAQLYMVSENDFFAKPSAENADITSLRTQRAQRGVKSDEVVVDSSLAVRKYIIDNGMYIASGSKLKADTIRSVLGVPVEFGGIKCIDDVGDKTAIQQPIGEAEAHQCAMLRIAQARASLPEAKRASAVICAVENFIAPVYAAKDDDDGEYGLYGAEQGDVVDDADAATVAGGVVKKSDASVSASASASAANDDTRWIDCAYVIVKTPYRTFRHISQPVNVPFEFTPSLTDPLLVGFNHARFCVEHGVHFSSKHSLLFPSLSYLTLPYLTLPVLL
jgi:hypothetical protein